MLIQLRDVSAKPMTEYAAAFAIFPAPVITGYKLSRL